MSKTVGTARCYVFFLSHTYESLDHLQYVSDDDVDEFQVKFGQLPGDYSDEFNEFTLHFIHQDGFEISNDKLGWNYSAPVCKTITKETSAGAFSCEFCEIFNNTSGWLLLEKIEQFFCLHSKQKTVQTCKLPTQEKG